MSSADLAWGTGKVGAGSANDEVILATHWDTLVGHGEPEGLVPFQLGTRRCVSSPGASNLALGFPFQDSFLFITNWHVCFARVTPWRKAAREGCVKPLAATIHEWTYLPCLDKPAGGQQRIRVSTGSQGIEQFYMLT